MRPLTDLPLPQGVYPMRARRLVPGVYPMRADECPVLALGTEPAHPIKGEAVMKLETHAGLLAQWRDLVREARAAGEPPVLTGVIATAVCILAFAALWMVLPGEWGAL